MCTKYALICKGMYDGCLFPTSALCRVKFLLFVPKHESFTIKLIIEIPICAAIINITLDIHLLFLASQISAFLDGCLSQLSSSAMQSVLLNSLGHSPGLSCIN